VLLWSLAVAAIAASFVAFALALTSDHAGSEPALRAELPCAS
jgi:hypothetical protein